METLHQCESQNEMLIAALDNTTIELYINVDYTHNYECIIKWLLLLHVNPHCSQNKRRINQIYEHSPQLDREVSPPARPLELNTLSTLSLWPQCSREPRQLACGLLPFSSHPPRWKHPAGRTPSAAILHTVVQTVPTGLVYSLLVSQIN